MHKMTSKKKCKGKSPKKDARASSPLLLEEFVEGFAFASFRTAEDLLNDQTAKSSKERLGKQLGAGTSSASREQSPYLIIKKEYDDTDKSIDGMPTATQLSQLPGTTGRSRKGCGGQLGKIKTENKRKSTSLLNGCPPSSAKKKKDKPKKCTAVEQKASAADLKRKASRKSDAKPNSAKKSNSHCIKYESSSTDSDSDHTVIEAASTTAKRVRNNVHINIKNKKTKKTPVDTRDAPMDTSQMSDHSDDTVIMGPESLRLSYNAVSISSEALVIDEAAFTTPKAQDPPNLHTTVMHDITPMTNGPVSIKLDIIKRPKDRLDRILSPEFLENHRHNNSKSSFEKLLDVAASQFATDVPTVVAAPNKHSIPDVVVIGCVGVGGARSPNKSPKKATPPRRSDVITSGSNMGALTLKNLDSHLPQKQLTTSERILEWRRKCMQDDTPPTGVNHHHGFHNELPTSTTMHNDYAKLSHDPRLMYGDGGMSSHNTTPVNRHGSNYSAAEAAAAAAVNNSKHQSRSNVAAPASGSTAKPFDRNALGPPPLNSELRRDFLPHHRQLPVSHQGHGEVTGGSSGDYYNKGHKTPTSAASITATQHPHHNLGSQLQFANSKSAVGSRLTTSGSPATHNLFSPSSLSGKSAVQTHAQTSRASPLSIRSSSASAQSVRAADQQQQQQQQQQRSLAQPQQQQQPGLGVGGNATTGSRDLYKREVKVASPYDNSYLNRYVVAIIALVGDLNLLKLGFTC